MKKMAKLENSIPISVQDENVSRKEAIARRPHKLCQKNIKSFLNTGITWSIGFRQNGRSLNGTKSDFRQNTAQPITHEENIISDENQWPRPWDLSGQARGDWQP
jgi:hypothetical protein